MKIGMMDCNNPVAGIVNKAGEAVDNTELVERMPLRRTKE